MNEEVTQEEKLNTLVEQISAYIEQYHGGSAELVSFEENVAKIRLGGACSGCPLSTATLKGWVQGTIHQFFPEIEVEAAAE
jgi:Fe-S cluster biogenesis protein NfuA